MKQFVIKSKKINDLSLLFFFKEYIKDGVILDEDVQGTLAGKMLLSDQQ